VAVSKSNPEDTVYQAVTLKELKIDDQGRIWRVAARRADRWTGTTRTIPCTPRRAEHLTGEYQQVRVMFDGHRYHAMAHRLIWRHFFGSIPPELTINHKNGTKTDNRPCNLELATSKEQTHHARTVLRRGRLDQFGERNTATKLTTDQVKAICARRADGELLRVIAADYGVREQTISKIVRGERRSLG
jgi:hypothetical protein